MKKLLPLLLLLAGQALGAVPSATSSSGPYTCNGVTTAYTAGFPFHANADLVVRKTFTSTGATSTLTITTDYTVTGAGAAAGGTVTLVAGSVCTSGWTLTIKRVVPITQPLALSPSGSYQATAKPIERSGFDRQTFISQQLDREKAQVSGGLPCAAGDFLTSADGRVLDCATPASGGGTVTLDGGTTLESGTGIPTAPAGPASLYMRRSDGTLWMFYESAWHLIAGPGSSSGGGPVAAFVVEQGSAGTISKQVGCTVVNAGAPGFGPYVVTLDVPLALNRQAIVVSGQPFAGDAVVVNYIKSSTTTILVFTEEWVAGAFAYGNDVGISFSLFDLGP